MAVRVLPFLLLLVLLQTLAGTEKVYAQDTIEGELELTSFSVDSTYYLSSWTLPETIQVYADGAAIDSTHWIFDELTGAWSIREVFRSQYLQVSSIRIRYRALSVSLQRVYQNREPLELDSSFYETGDDSLARELLSSNRSTVYNSDLQQQGSLSRGIIVGTNQDFALESGLQFELNGQITEDVRIHASLTDRSIPIQPDGTTQNLREFDKVFIQLQSQKTTVEMGDVDVSFQQSTFARLNRRLQGAAGYTDTNYGDYSGALSVVRGTYKSQSFQGRDGVQGPYRLTGRDGDEFVIILAGTERVYINGQLVNRGEENQYIIDYGLGEVYFTNNLFIKDETRIVIEYEYIDQNFSRTLVAAEGSEQFGDGRFTIGASVIRQADGDELLSQRTLSEDDIEVLKNAGDNLSSAVVSGERLADEDDDNNIRYAKVDTLYNGQVYQIYKNIPGSAQSAYIVSFTKVGSGNGSYNRVGGSVNGLLYEWVGPGLGEYSPFRKLPAPEEQSMVALNSSFNITDHVSVFGEWAASNFDQNRFSALDDGDNNDLSYLTGFKIEKMPSAIGEVDARVSRRYSGKNFTYFERTKEVEFNRKWNIYRDIDSEESINEAALSISPSSNTTIGGGYGFVDRSDFRGYRQEADLQTNEPGVLNLSYRQDWVRNEDELLEREGNWFRQNGNLGKEVYRGLTPYIGFEQEFKEDKSLVTDSLLQTSLSFYEVGPGVRLSKQKFDVDMSVYFREEKRVLDNSMQKESDAIEQRVKLNFRPSNYLTTRNEVAVRNKEYTEAFELQGRSNRKGLLLRSVTDYEMASGFWNGQFFYEANTEQQALFQEAYIEVGPELGQYVWVDDSGDGVQQIDEFYPELSPNEGTFVRQFLPSDELFPVIDLRVRFRNEFKPFSFMQKQDGFAGVLSEVILRSRFDISENSTTEELSDIYLLRLNTFRSDSTTIQGRFFWEKELDLLNGYQGGDLVLGYNQNNTLNKRSTESVDAYADLFYLNSLYRLTDRTSLRLDFSRGEESSVSDRLNSRNFDIRSLVVTPGVETVISRSWQSSLSFSYSQKRDHYPATPVDARVIKITNSHRMFLWRKIQANARLEIRNAEVDGSSSALGTFELTEGTGLGTNLLWSLSGSYRVSNLIRLSFNYDGRTIKDRPDIHTTKLVVSAVF